MNIIDVVQYDYCTGCGVCTAVAGDSVSVRKDARGILQADVTNLTAEALETCNKVCPFSDAAPDETEIAKHLFPEPKHCDEIAGRYENAYAGWVNEGRYREVGSSGGMGTWVLVELLRSGEVDHVVNVHQIEDVAGGPPQYQFRVVSKAEDIIGGAKSRYYPITYADALQEIKKIDGAVAIIGIPCFIKAVRSLSVAEPLYRAKIKYTVGLLCGHLKSARYLDLFVLNMGQRPDEVTKFNFRKKFPDKNAHDYGVEIEGRDGETGRAFAKSITANSVFGTNWGHGMFKYHGCDFCDDVFSETADVVIGDAWVPGYDEDWQGANVVIVRNRKIGALVERARQEGRLQLDEITREQLHNSQRGSIRHRKLGLSYRLKEKARLSIPAPRKRTKAIEPAQADAKLNNLFVKRMEISKESHLAFMSVGKPEELKGFEKRMRTLIREYEIIQDGMLGYGFKKISKTVLSGKLARKLIQITPLLYNVIWRLRKWRRGRILKRIS